jgi:hypothetical protein
VAVLLRRVQLLLLLLLVVFGFCVREANRFIRYLGNAALCRLLLTATPPRTVDVSRAPRESRVAGK